jgi:molecular chaperone DnaK
MGNVAWSVSSGKSVYRPCHIAGLILATVRRSLLRAYPGQLIERVTITTPASFSSAMRRETLEAARLAGFPPDRTVLLDEPVAAFLSLFAEVPPEDLPDPATVLVFDMGGGTLDVSVMEYRRLESTIELLSTSRYNEVAGDDLDLELAAMVLRQARMLDSAVLPDKGEPGFGLGMLAIGEQVKMALNDLIKREGPRLGSFTTKINAHANSPINVPIGEQFPGVSPQVLQLKAAELLKSIEPFFDEDDRAKTSRTIFVPLDQALQAARKTRENIHKVYLTGGSSEFLPVQDAIQRSFGTLPNRLEPFHAVALGALVWAANAQTHSIHLREYLFENLYLQRVGNRFFKVLEAPIPVPADGEQLQWVNASLPTGNEAIHLPEQSRQVRLNFFRGCDLHDPSMTLAHSELLEVPHNVREGAPLRRLEAAVDRHKVFHCQFQFEGHGGEVKTRLDFSSIDGRPASTNRYERGLVLNGEPLLSSD